MSSGVKDGEGKDNVQERLHRIFANNLWRDRFCQVKVEHLGFNSSDHSPLLLVCNPLTEVPRKRGKKFQFEPFWLKEEDIGTVVSDTWSVNGPSNSVGDLKAKLNWCASSLSSWSKVRFGNMGKQIEDISREIELLYRRCGDKGVMQMIKSLEKGVEGFLEKDEIYWKQRSRADWLSAGDRNSKFFHNRASARKRKNFISFLHNKNGCLQETDEGMADTIREYFADLFRSSAPSPSPSTIRKFTGGIHERLTEEMRNDLNRVFTADEIKAAVFNMGPTKAPGPDGFQALFFQKFWGVVGADFSNICLRVLSGESSIKEFNKTNVVLIPKTLNPISLKDFRPISLCSVVYKAVEKVLANRMKPLLPSLISNHSRPLSQAGRFLTTL
ncbi:hypothetical protein Dsin_000822 [Dipteronia sinensis]|uniref:Reverse transcriptase n=1 Tax=Dipteronia sinensis TaxID=43782 RepID=A0AAE0B2P2_9ROSI|nr:hypothetical protein Dsin_000822 [Dipteronia sinensis]